MIFRPWGVVSPTPLGVDFSRLRSKFKNRLDEVNCIVISYKSHPQAPLSSMAFGL